MTETQDSVPIREKTPSLVREIEELLGSLVGIASARVALSEGGEVEEAHLLALPAATREAVTQSAISALRARFDLEVDRRRIFVARIQEAGARQPPSGPAGPAGSGGSGGSGDVVEGEAPSGRVLFPHPEPDEVSPPPWPERAPGEPGQEDLGEGLESASSRRIPGDPGEGRAGGLESRLLFLGHRTSKRRFEGVEVAVEVEWRGRRHRGAASVRDEPPDRLAAPALATLRALGAALEERPRADEPGREVRLTLRGVEMVEALGERHVMVSILAELGHRKTPLTGAVVVDDSVELATILATLQATDRRVRAVLLNHLPGNGGPPKRSPG